MFWNKKILKRKYTWNPDLPDHRDVNYDTTNLTSAAILPSSIDLRKNCPVVYDQGSLGSCTANALAGAIQILETIDKIAPTMMSRLFIYYNERVIEGTVNQDAGAQLRDGIKALASYGVCSETDWPYNIGKFKTKPTSQSFIDGLAHTITSYQRLNTLLDMRTCLAAGYPFVFGFTVYQSFETDIVAKTGIVPMPSKNERALGGHAVLAVGYDDKTKMILVRNSWGPNWGLSGYFYLPYDYISNINLATDFWTIRRGNKI